jgi:DNA-directed RNA polymerase specialized sigma24 family protein
MEIPEDPLTPEQTEVLRGAWADLQPRWRYILWELEIQGRKPAEIAREIDMSPNAVSALAKRARQGLRAAVAARLG